MTTSPISKKSMKGALIGIDIFNPVASAILFQYTPDTVTRSLQTQTSGDGGAKSETLRLGGAPVETIKMEIEIDGTDLLEQGDKTTIALGIHPQLAALEMLIYPKSSQVTLNTTLMGMGTIEVVPPVAPVTVLVWGLKRQVPVRLTEFSITEEAYDVNLNPIRARVSLGLRVLSYNDLGMANPSYYHFLAHQTAKEVFATMGSAADYGKMFTGETKITEFQL